MKSTEGRVGSKRHVLTPVVLLAVALAMIVALPGTVSAGAADQMSREDAGRVAEFLADAERTASLVREDVRRAAELRGDAQRVALLALLEVVRTGPAGTALVESVFFYEDSLRPALRALLSEPKASKDARALLALIGVPEDFHLIIQSAPPPMRGPFANRWAYHVVTSLLEPSSELEWGFLRRCALNDYDDRWVDAGAIQTLKLIASPRSQEMLEEIGITNEYRAKSAARGREYIRSSPPPLEHQQPEVVANRVAEAVKIGAWEGNRPPRYNRVGDKALINIDYYARPDRLVYTATLHIVGGLWKLRGIRETYQAFEFRGLVPTSPSPALPPPPALPAIPIIVPMPLWLQPQNLPAFK